MNLAPALSRPLNLSWDPGGGPTCSLGGWDPSIMVVPGLLQEQNTDHQAGPPALLLPLCSHHWGQQRGPERFPSCGKSPQKREASSLSSFPLSQHACTPASDLASPACLRSELAAEGATSSQAASLLSEEHWHGPPSLTLGHLIV